MLRRVRWSDGQLVSYRQDLVALGLHMWSVASGITVTVLWIGSSRWAAWWVLIPVSLANSLSSEFIARVRLRRAVRRTEALGSAGQAQIKTRLMDPVRRFDDWVISKCDRKAAEFLARAETARASGDRASEARYLRRAERERKYGQWYERTVERYGRFF